MLCDSGGYKRRPNKFYVLVVWYNSNTSDFLCWQPFYLSPVFTSIFQHVKRKNRLIKEET